MQSNTNGIRQNKYKIVTFRILYLNSKTVITRCTVMSLISVAIVTTTNSHSSILLNFTWEDLNNSVQSTRLPKGAVP